jgi:hypothetical protein
MNLQICSSSTHIKKLFVPAIQKAEFRRISVQGHSKEKVSKTPSQQISWVWWFTPVSYMEV